MKLNHWCLALGLLSTAAAGIELNPSTTANLVRVSGITASIAHRGCKTVKAQARFSNRCRVPDPENLIVAHDFGRKGELNIVLLEKPSDRICTMEMAPVSVDINLGTFCHPADGAIRKILVNGKVAR